MIPFSDKAIADALAGICQNNLGDQGSRRQIRGTVKPKHGSTGPDRGPTAQSRDSGAVQGGGFTPVAIRDDYSGLSFTWKNVGNRGTRPHPVSTLGWLWTFVCCVTTGAILVLG